MSIVLGIDASRNRSGGARAHLIGILGESDPPAHGIGEIHVWSYKALLNALPDAPWLIKHNPRALEGSLVSQAWWQYRQLPREIRAAGCDILLTTDAGSVCGFHPAVVMSRDMLSYDEREMERYGFSPARLRLALLRFIQTRSMRNASGVIFLTEHAARVIQGTTGILPCSAVIPHGVGSNFRMDIGAPQPWIGDPARTVRCLYVSTVDLYKHQWTVVRAIGQLRERGYNVSLTLVGAGFGRAQTLLDAQIAKTDPERRFVTVRGHVPHEKLPPLLRDTDLVIFASSCENMPVTLLEAMSSGRSIACSDRSPMPELLQDGGLYFDPENASSIAAAVERILEDPVLRRTIATRARELSSSYSWRQCADQTWNFVRANLERAEYGSPEPVATEARVKGMHR